MIPIPRGAEVHALHGLPGLQFLEFPAYGSRVKPHVAIPQPKPASQSKWNRSE
jgi:hypothetical protein